MSQKERRKLFQKETKRRKNTFPAALRQPPPGLDNPQKIHYTTNRKGAVSCKRLAPYPRIKELTAQVGKHEAVISFVHFYIAIQKSNRAGRHAKKRTAALGLDNPLKIHYTTNRKGAVSYKRLAPYLRIKEIDRSSLVGVRRSFLLSIFILPLCNFPCDIKSTEQDRKDQAQQTDDDR